MSWWKLSNTGNDYTGDIPADIIHRMLNSINVFTQEQTNSKPTINSFLELLIVIIQPNSISYLLVMAEIVVISAIIKIFKCYPKK